jgi:2,3-bisphosphoglycerate-independent phosphoglycerate mutase
MRGAGLDDQLTDTDPQVMGVAPLAVRAKHAASARAAAIANGFVEQARRLLADSGPANAIMLRGFARLPHLRTLPELYGLRAGAIALHGMYRGVARLAGMQVLPVPGSSLEDEFTALECHWSALDFFYLHVKKTDTYGEQGDFDAKVKAIEEVDALIPRLLALQPDVIIIGGDHSSPAVLKSHSWHPVPVIIYGANVRPDGIGEFGERACARGSLGVLPATHLLPLALANAGRISKYGA